MALRITCNNGFEPKNTEYVDNDVDVDDVVDDVEGTDAYFFVAETQRCSHATRGKHVTNTLKEMAASMDGSLAECSVEEKPVYRMADVRKQCRRHGFFYIRCEFSTAE